MVYQAGEDAKAFAEELDRRRRAHAAELAALEARLTAEHAESAERAAASLAALASEIERYERRVTALATALERAGVDAELAAESASRDAALTTTRLLEEQHDAHTRATAECLVRERVERHAALDEIRARLDALRMVLDVNDANLRASHASNRASLAVFAMDDAVSRGAPFAREAALLRAAFTGADGTCEDSLVHAVLASISEETARRGAPTTAASLRLRLVDAERAARSLALVPGGRDGGGGVLTYFVSALAAMCRVGESVTAEGGGVEAALAKAARAMAEGVRRGGGGRVGVRNERHGGGARRRGVGGGREGETEDGDGDDRVARTRHREGGKPRVKRMETEAARRDEPFLSRNVAS